MHIWFLSCSETQYYRNHTAINMVIFLLYSSKFETATECKPENVALQFLVSLLCMLYFHEMDTNTKYNNIKNNTSP